jgi:hypothetical protein
MVSGTTNDEEFYQKMMGNYTIFADRPIIQYQESLPRPGVYPVYQHVFHLGEQV